ncbi:hypothetical protein D0Y65_006292 [Glycine soja]|uniref:Replication protein A 70 kDa DNA-binding subunit B/D first OB fold domain-containing protein n=1 Tax=Glycine soja TaxID=3848 RepID=A0A445L810_GLYSO|nr:hypothetical protein D0Y65_006292 [Glycine soja]
MEWLGGGGGQGWGKVGNKWAGGGGDRRLPFLGSWMRLGPQRDQSRLQQEHVLRRQLLGRGPRAHISSVNRGALVSNASSPAAHPILSHRQSRHTTCQVFVESALTIWFCSVVRLGCEKKSVSFVEKFVLEFAFASLLGLTVKRKVWFSSVVRLAVRRKVWFCCVAGLDCEKKSLVLMHSYMFVASFVNSVYSHGQVVNFGFQWLRWLCDYKVMARVPDKIKLIDGSREALKLSIRITDLWFIGIPEKSEQAEMVVVDSDGDEIHVVCKQDQLKPRKADLKENLTYVMHNFKVMKNDEKFRVCDHEYKLCFTGVTVVRQSDMEHLPFRKFRFVDFSNVIAGHFQTRLLVDVTGVVDEVVLSCTLWENYCLQFLSYLNEVEDERPIVILLTHARIKEAQGSYLLSVSNSFKASKLMINELVLEIQDFRERKSNVSFFKQEIVCVTVAKITTIVMDNYSWCYPACGQCYKKNDIEIVSFTCPCGKENDQPVLRLLSIFILLFSCKDDDVDLNASPQALDRLLGCFLAFKVKVQPRFRNSVLKYLDESDLINVVLDMLPDSEPCCKIENSILESTDPTELESQSVSATVNHDRSMLDSTEPTELESQSVSITGDHDPLLRISLTPTKHVSSDELDDEPKNFQISPAQVSSNKLAKHSQAE